MHGERSRKVKALTKARYVNTLCGLLCDDAGPCHRPADAGVPYGIPVTPVFQYEQAELPRGVLEGSNGTVPGPCATLSGFSASI